MAGRKAALGEKALRLKNARGKWRGLGRLLWSRNCLGVRILRLSRWARREKRNEARGHSCADPCAKG